MVCWLPHRVAAVFSACLGDPNGVDGDNGGVPREWPCRQESRFGWTRGVPGVESMRGVDMSSHPEAPGVEKHEEPVSPSDAWRSAADLQGADIVGAYDTNPGPSPRRNGAVVGRRVSGIPVYRGRLAPARPEPSVNCDSNWTVLHASLFSTRDHGAGVATSESRAVPGGGIGNVSLQCGASSND